jgi:hypothetical protein
MGHCWNQKEGGFSWAEQGASSEVIFEVCPEKKNTLGDDFL